MASPETDDFWEVPKQSPVMWVDLKQDGNRRELHYGNASIYVFAGAWALANHVFIQRDETVDPPLPSVHVFNSQEFMDELQANGFPMHSLPWPCDGDVLAFRNYQRELLDSELENL